jgi:hypothetical protein
MALASCALLGGSRVVRQIGVLERARVQRDGS